METVQAAQLAQLEPELIDDDADCSSCNGTGEGMTDGSRCLACNGRGYWEPKKYRWDEED